MAHPKEILLLLQANARKSLSQNFLTSPHWAEKLASCALEPPISEIWEIGPGLGALTEHLVKKKNIKIRLFEYDKKFAPYLKGKFPGVEVLQGDFLKAPIETLLPSTGKLSILSNLPYHISSEVIFRLIGIKRQVARMVLTFQKEFAERILGKPKSKSYGSLSVMAQTHFEIDSLGVLPASAFYPAPSIASEALLFEPRTEIIPDNFEKLVRASFSQRRKKMQQNLRKAFPDKDWPTLFKKLKISENTRAEELEREDFLEVAKMSLLSVA